MKRTTTKVMTPEEFKQRWDADDTGGGITFDDIAEVAKAWGLFQTPRIHSLDRVCAAVLKAAGCKTGRLGKETQP